MSDKFTEPVRILLTEIIDYAGLFPPSKLPMAEAVINYATYFNSNYNWMLGRFVVPVERLDELAENARDFFGRGKNRWRLSVLAGEDVYKTVRAIEKFNLAHDGKAVCDSLEIKAQSTPEIENASAHIPENLTAYFELPLNEDLAEMAVALAIHKKRAKIRTGGITPDAFPNAEQIIRFMRVCLAANVPFKCTAGLHHPIRCVKPLTYERNAPTGSMHGFLNVFLAAALLRQGYKTKLVRELLEDDWAESFRFDETGVLWRQEFFIGTAEIENLRRRTAISFGSCSFEEPIGDLQEIGLL